MEVVIMFKQSNIWLGKLIEKENKKTHPVEKISFLKKAILNLFL